MTQLFDTTSYDATEIATVRQALGEGRHLRSVATGTDTPAQKINWRLDDQTIEAGRRGLAKAREALRQSRTTAPATERRAA